MKIKKIVSVWLKCLTALSPLIAISDIVFPLAPFGLYITYFLTTSFLISLLIRFVPRWNLAARQRIGEMWYGTFASVLLTLSILMLFAYNISANAPDEKGYLSSKFKIVGEMQSDLNIIQVGLNEIKGTIESIDQKIDLAKKESSDDPRKELANLGHPWTGEAFDKAIRARELEIIGLYLDGGMKPESNIEEYHNGILWLIGKDHLPLKNEVFELLLRKGLDPNFHSEGALRNIYRGAPTDGRNMKRYKELVADFEGSVFAATAKMQGDTDVLELLKKYGLRDSYSH